MDPFGARLDVVYESLMQHWPGVTWDYIEANWTDSQFAVLYGALVDRLEREREEYESARHGRGGQPRGSQGGAKRASGMAGISALTGQKPRRYPRLRSDRAAGKASF